MNDKEKYTQLKEAGICVYCKSKKADDGYATCGKCRKRQKQMSRDRRAWLKIKNFCPQCGSEKLIGDEKICPECSMRKYLSNKKSKTYDVDYYRQRREKLKSKGICTQCGKRKAESRKTMCRICLDKKLTYRRRHMTDLPRVDWIAYGRCYGCGESIPNGKLCEKCRDRAINNLHSINKLSFGS